MMDDDSFEGPGDGCGTTSIKRKNATRSTCAQLLATLIQSWLLIGIGMELAMPTLVLAALHRHPAERLNMDDDQASWFGSLPSFTHPIGSLLSGYLQEQFGRRGTMVWINIPILTGWLTLYFADSIDALYAGCILIGLCSGLCEAPLHSYIGEMAEPHLRGTMSTLSTASVGISYLLTYVIGYKLNWRTMVLIAAAIPVITFVCMTQIPESPTWLIEKNRLEDAQKSLRWLRGWVKPDDVHKEFLDLVKYTRGGTEESSSEPLQQKPPKAVQLSEKEMTLECQKDDNLKTKFKKITYKKVLLPLRLEFIVVSFVQCTSLAGLKPFLVGIFDKFGTPDSKFILIIYGVASFGGMVANMILIRRFGKRKLALLSQIVATASILFLAVSCSFFPGPEYFPRFFWIPALLILVNKFSSSLGLIPLQWQLVSEIFPPSGRGNACGISAAWVHMTFFLTIKSFLFLEAWMQFSGVMYFYGAIGVLGAMYLYYYLPETEGKSLEQIESYFTKDHDRKEKFSMARSNRKTSSKSRISLDDTNQQKRSIMWSCDKP